MDAHRREHLQRRDGDLRRHLEDRQRHRLGCQHRRGERHGGALTNSSSTAGTYAGLIALGSASSIIAGSGNITISNTGTITGATFGLTLGGAYNGSIASIIGTTTGTLTKAGAGTWILSGTNTYTGTTTVNGGLLQLNAAETAGTSGPLGKPATAANSIVLQGGGLQFTTNNTYDYTTSGRLQLADGFTGTIDTNGQSVTFANAIGVGTLKSGALTKAGTGTLTLSGVNTFNGKTLVSGGTLALGNALALQNSAIDTSGAGNINVTGYAAPTFGGLLDGAGAQALASVITAGYGSVTGITLNPGTGITDSYSGVIANGAAGMTLAKSGAGTQILSGSNSYTGLTTVSVGVLNIQNATALGTTAAGTSVTGGAALQIQGGITVGAEALTLNGTGINSDGALRNVGGTNVWQGTVTLGSAARINSDSGSLTFNTAANSITGTQNLTLGGAGAGTIAGTITTGSGTLTKDGAGTWTLQGANTYTGLTTVSGGTLTVDAGAGGSLYGTTPYSALTFGGTGAFNYNNTTAAGAKSQNMGALTFSLGDGTVTATRTALQTVGLTFSSLAARAAGATGNFVLGGTPGTPGTDDTITLTGKAAGFIDQGTFFGGSNYAWMNAAGTYVRGINYAGDTGAATSAGGTTLTGTAYQQITGAITAQNTATFTTLNISGNNNFTLAGSQTVTVNGILMSGNTAGGATISGGTGIKAASAAELVIRTDGANDALTISTPILANGANALTKSGAGTLALSAANTYTGSTYLDAGTLNINNAAALGTGTFVINGGTIDNTSGAAITTSTNNNAQTWNNDFAFTGLAGGTHDLNMGTGAVTLGTAAGISRTITVNAGNLTIGGIIYNGTTATSLIKAGAGALTLSGGNNVGFTGGVTLNAGTLNINNNGALGYTSALTTFTINGGALDNTSGAAITTSNNYVQTWNNDFAFTGTNNLTFGSGAVTLGTAAGTSRTITVNAGTLYEQGIISNGTTANSLVKAGNGALSLSGASTFTGGVTLNAGTLNINSAAALGATIGTFTISGGTISNTSGGGVTTNNYAQTWAGDFSFGFAGMLQTNNLNMGTGAVSLGTGAGTTRTITTAGLFGTMTEGGVISDGTTAKGLIKNGPGYLVLTGANTFSGGVTLNAGTLTLGAAAALGTGPLTITGGYLATNGAALTLTTNNTQAWNGDFTVIGSTLNYSPAALTFGNGAITLGGNRTVLVAGSTLTLPGAIGDGGNGYGVTWVAGLYQNFANGGSPMLTLTGASTYSGATVIQSRNNGVGSVILGGTLANTSSVTVNGGGSFSFSSANNPINPAATLTLGGNGGGYFAGASGSNIQSLTSLTVGSGADNLVGYYNGTAITFTGANPYLRSVGGVVRMTGLNGASAFTSAPSGAANVIGSGATAMLLGATYSSDTATTSADNFMYAASGVFTALTSASNSWGSGINTGVVAGSTATGTVSQSLRFSAGGSLTLPGAFTVESGGILAAGNSTTSLTSPVTITGGTIKTGLAGSDLWVVQGGAASASTGMVINSQIIDNSSSSLTKDGPRALYLTNTNNTYAGGTYIGEGILNVASAGSLGGGALNFTGAVTGQTSFAGAATLQAAGDIALGSRAVTIGQGVSATFDTNGHNITVGGVISGLYSSLNKTGTGTLTLTGQNTYTGFTDVTNGTLALDFSAAGAPASDIINASSLLNLGSVLSYGAPATAVTSDTLSIQGKAGTANSQSFSGVSPNPLFGSTLVGQGMSHLNLAAGASGGTLTVNLGSLTLGLATNNVNTGLDIAIGSGVTVTTTTPLTSNGILGTASTNSGTTLPWVTVNGSSWATLSGNNIIGLANASYNNIFINGGNVDLLASVTATSNPGVITLRFNDTSATAADMTLTLKSLVLTSINGILVTGNVGAHTSTIAGGFLQGYARRCFGVFQNNTAGDLVISSQLSDTNGAEALDKYGAGRLILTGINTITGATYVNEGTVVATGDYTPQLVQTFTPNGTTTVTVGTTNGLFVGQNVTGTGLTYGSTFIASIGSGTITLTTTVAGSTPATGTFESGGALGGSCAVANTGNGGSSINEMIGTSGTLQIGNGSTHGSLDPNYTISNLGALVLNRSDSYTFGNQITGSVVDNSLAGTVNTNTLEIKGGGTATLGFSGTVNGTGAAAQKIYTLSTAGNVYVGQVVTGTNIAANTTVSYIDGLNVYLNNNIATGGATNVTFSTANTFAGTTKITGGSTLVLGSTLALQNSTLNYYNSDSGTFSFGTLTAATLGGLNGDKNLALTNASAAAVALTLGGNQLNTAYSGNLSETGAGASLTKTGIGTMVLTGANSYTGGTTISAGTLQIGSAGTTGSLTGAVTDNATLAFNRTDTYGGTVSNAISGTGAVAVNGGTLTLGGTNNYSGGTTISGAGTTLMLGSATALGANTSAATVAAGAALDLNGTVMTNTNALTLNGTGISSGGALLNSSATSGTYAGLISLGSASSIIAGSGNITVSNAGTISGATFGLTLGGAYNGSITSIIGTTTGTLTKQGAGTWTLSGASTYTGTTTVTGGLIGLNVAETAGTSGPLGKPATLANSIVLQGGGLQFTSANTYDYTTSGRLQLADASTGTIDTNGQSVTFANAIGVGTLKSGALTKAGSGTLTLSGTNSFTGVVTINNGEVRLGSAGALNSTAGQENAVAFGSGVPNGILSLNGNDVTIANLTTDPTTPGTTFVQTMSTGTHTLTVGNSQNSSGVFAGIIQEFDSATETLALTKAGTGTLTLTGANTYVGLTTISAGTLQIGNGSTTGSLSAGSAIADNTNFAIKRSNAVAQGTDFSSAAITGSGTFTQAGTGTTTLSAANAFLGKTIVQNGTVSFTTGNATATAAQSLGENIALDLGVAGTSSGILKYTGTGAATLAKNINALGNGSDTIQNSATGTAKLTLSGSLVKNGTTLTLKGGTSGINVTGTISGTNGGTHNSDLDITGGTTTLSAVATYDGPTWIYGSGVLVNNVSGGALPTGTSINIGTPGANGSAIGSTTTAGTFDLSGNNQTVAGLNTEGTGTYTSDIVTNSSGSSDAALTVSGGGAFAGTIQDGATKKTSLAVTGGTLTLAGTNSYTGTTTVSVGTLLINSSTNAGSAVAVSSGGTLGGTGTVGGTTGVTGGTINGTGLTLSGLATFNSTGNTLGGTVTASGGVTVNGSLANSATVTGGATINGTLTGSGGSFSGASTLSGGTINLTSGSFGSTLGVTGTSAWNGAGSVTGAVTASSGTFTIGSGANLTASSGLAVSGTGTLAGTGTVTGSVNYTSASSSTFGGAIAGSGNTLTMNNSAAALALSGTNTYTGATTVTSGTLLVNGSTSSSSAVTVNGGTLGGSGTIGGSVTVNSGGFLAPGNASTGVLTVASLALSSGSTTEFEINANTGAPGTNYDQIVVNAGGALALNGAFTIAFGASPLTNYIADIKLFDFTAGHSSGDFASVSSTGYYTGTWTASGAAGAETFTYNNGTQMLTFSEVTGNLNVVPEPTTWALLAFSLTTVMVLRRRRDS